MVQISFALSEVWVLAISFVLLGVFNQHVVAQEKEDKPMRTIYPCDIKVKAKGAEFSFTYSTWVTAGADGKIANVTPFTGESRKLAANFVDQDNFMTCVKKWTLEPNGKYIVNFRVATMSLGAPEPRNYVLIIGPGESDQKLKMELLWSFKDTLIVPERPSKAAPQKGKPGYRKDRLK